MFGMRLGLGLGSGASTPPVTESVWTINPAADGTKYVRLQCATTGQTLTVTGGAEIKLTSGGTWGTSVDIPSGATNRDVYFRGNGTGGKLLIPSPQNVTYLLLNNAYIAGSINGMALTYLLLSNTGTNVTGTPAQIGTPLLSIRILYGTSYDYPWTSQTFGGTKRTWTATTMEIDCVADAPTPEQFNTWLLGLASVSNPATGTVFLTLKNTPTLDAMTAEGLVGDGSGYYAMTTTLGYTLVLGE